MVRVPGSSGDSGYHRESHEDEEVPIKLESGMEASSEAGSPTTLLNEEGSAELQSAGRSSADRNEEEVLLEEKPQLPPYASSGGTADHDVNRDPPSEEPKVKTEGTPPTNAPLMQKSLRKKKTKASRKKLKAPADSDSDSRDEIAVTLSDDQLEEAFNRNELQVFLVKNPIMLSEIYEKLKVLVGEAETQTKVETKLKAAPTQLPSSASPTGSSQHSHYASVTSTADSDTSEGMQLGPSGAAMLQTRSQRVPNAMPRADAPVAASRLNEHTHRLQTFFNSAMERFLKEQRAAQGTPSVPLMRRTEPQNVDMASMESEHGEYDQDDLDLSVSREATAVTAATTTGLPAIAPCICLSAMSESKELSGKDDDEDRARAWISKTCLVLGGLFTGPARNWYRQLSRTTRGDWKVLLRELQVQLCGLGVSVARQYYHASKRADETPLEYLHQLNVAGLRAKLRVKSGPSDVSPEHAEHFIETLDYRDLAEQLALMRISDAGALEEVLRARQRAKNRQGRAHFGSSKYRQKTASSDATKSAPTRKVQAIVTANLPESDSDSGLSGSESDGDLRRIYLAATEGESKTAPDEPDRTASPHGRPQFHRCTHCGSHRHDDLHCWKRLTCQRCGKRGHPSDHCLFVCRGCGEIHDAGKCQMEAFYNFIRQWYDPAKHGGVLPGNAEKMRSKLCIYAYFEKRSEVSQRKNLIDNTCDLYGKHTSVVASLRKPDEFARVDTVMALQLLPGEMRGYWKYRARSKWFKQAKTGREINNEKADLLLDSGAEVSIVDAAFAPKIKVTLAGSLGYFFDVWVGEMTGQNAILGMDFMVPLSGRRPLYGEHVSAVRLEEPEVIEAGQKIAIPLRSKPLERLWLTRGEHWIPTLVEGSGWRRYLQAIVCRDVKASSPSDHASSQKPAGPMVSRPQYDPPKSILKRAAVSNQNAKVPDQKEDENAAEEIPKGDGTEGLAKMRPM
ncbi:hypothetical protein F443_18298 [Phytophthora nicotianae P1569]|uniref:CCHC-type domain-containing protein n=1 Tax=Phytophthora nicotianae P1569 TaxID=1317065 RepID=V9E8N7_PHYNI|nr:hypothetical protein F443_18298 [Phytophthora nicotianae P1569]